MMMPPWSLVCLAVTVTVASTQYLSDGGENEKRNDFSRDIMHFGKRAYGNGRLVAYGGPAFERDMMAFGKRSGGFEREMMSFGKRSPFEREFLSFGKRGSEFDREMLSFGKRDEFERSMMAFGRRRK
ncbi:hypothetical protein V3C99_014328 [Haemonchus contortus]|uniref:FMRFamide n=1 Tax=Haemonchus contortus TaxID=6289 RepID=A0A7I4YUX8_HAECO|nr:AF17 C protein [Haemonchus contortus]